MMILILYVMHTKFASCFSSCFSFLVEICCARTMVPPFVVSNHIEELNDESTDDERNADLPSFVYLAFKFKCLNASCDQSSSLSMLVRLATLNPPDCIGMSSGE
jgi:hypothetical protein